MIASLFAAPTAAFLIAALLVGGCGVLIYRAGRSWPTIYWKQLSLAAEVCIAVGLIGLAIFAGRIKIGADHQLGEQRLQLAQSHLADSLRLAIVESCQSSGQAAAPYNPTVVRGDLCAIARASVDVRSPTIDWASTEQSLAGFPERYPGCVDNVFTRHSDCEQPVTAATRLAAAIRATEMEKRDAGNDAPMAALLNAPDGWGALLLPFFLVAIGVTIKCARAATELYPAGPVRR